MRGLIFVLSTIVILGESTQRIRRSTINGRLPISETANSFLSKRASNTNDFMASIWAKHKKSGDEIMVGGERVKSVGMKNSEQVEKLTENALEKTAFSGWSQDDAPVRGLPVPNPLALKKLAGRGVQKAPEIGFEKVIMPAKDTVLHPLPPLPAPLKSEDNKQRSDSGFSRWRKQIVEVRRDFAKEMPEERFVEMTENLDGLKRLKMAKNKKKDSGFEKFERRFMGKSSYEPLAPKLLREAREGRDAGMVAKGKVGLVKGALNPLPPKPRQGWNANEMKLRPPPRNEWRPRQPPQMKKPAPPPQQLPRKWANSPPGPPSPRFRRLRSNMHFKKMPLKPQPVNDAPPPTPANQVTQETTGKDENMYQAPAVKEAGAGGNNEILSEAPAVNEGWGNDEISFETPAVKEAWRNDEKLSETPAVKEAWRNDEILSEAPAVKQAWRNDEILSEAPAVKQAWRNDEILSETPAVKEAWRNDEILPEAPAVKQAWRNDEKLSETPAVKEAWRNDAKLPEAPAVKQAWRNDEKLSETPAVKEAWRNDEKLPEAPAVKQAWRNDEILFEAPAVKQAWRNDEKLPEAPVVNEGWGNDEISFDAPAVKEAGGNNEIAVEKIDAAEVAETPAVHDTAPATPVIYDTKPDPTPSLLDTETALTVPPPTPSAYEVLPPAQGNQEDSVPVEVVTESIPQQRETQPEPEHESDTRSSKTKNDPENGPAEKLIY